MAGRKYENRPSRNSKKEVVQEFCDTTTFHGIPEIADSQRCISWLFWTLVFLGCCAFFCYNAWHLFFLFVSQQITTSITYQPQAAIKLPNLVMCPHHRVTVGFLHKHNFTHGPETQRFLEYMYTLFWDNYLFEYDFTKENTTDLDTAFIKMFKQVEKDANKKLNLETFFKHTGLKCEDFLRVCQTSGNAFDCCKRANIVVTNYGACFRLDFTQTAVQQYAGHNGGLRFVLDLNPSQVAHTFFNSYLDWGVTLLIGHRHLPNEPIPMDPNSINIAPGKHAHIELSETNTSFVKDCASDKRLTYFEGYEPQACFYECLVQAAYEDCGCAPIGYGIFKHFPKLCNQTEMITCAKPILRDGLITMQNSTFQTKVIPCHQECTTPCHGTQYLSVVESIAFHRGKDQENLHEFFGLEADSREPDEERFVLVDYYFKTMTVTSVDEAWMYNANSMISNVGGLLGLCIGGSAVTLVHMVVYVCTWMCACGGSKESAIPARQRSKLQSRPPIYRTYDSKLY